MDYSKSDSVVEHCFVAAVLSLPLIQTLDSHRLAHLARPSRLENSSNDLQLAVNQFSVHDHSNRFGLVDVIAVNVKQVLIQNNQVGLFANLD